MSTSTVEVGALTTEKQTYRAYVSFETDANGKTVIKEFTAKAETAKKDSKTGLSENWQKLEDKGYTLLSENEFIKYTVKDETGFHALVPDTTQRTYIIQCGLNYIQNAKANAKMAELQDGTPEPTAAYNQETIDLREAINEPPSRKSLTDLEKLERLLAGLNLTKEQKEQMLLSLAQTVASSDEAE